MGMREVRRRTSSGVKIPKVDDYFPDRYMNQATKNEEPVATF